MDISHNCRRRSNMPSKGATLTRQPDLLDQLGHAQTTQQ